MKLQGLLDKYIENTEVVLTEIQIVQTAQIENETVNNVIETAKNYLEDAKYYREREGFETGLASVEYSEGLLDALRLLKVAEFHWPKRKQ